MEGVKRELLSDNYPYNEWRVEYDNGAVHYMRECQPHFCIVHPNDDSCIYCACPIDEIDNTIGSF